MRPIANTGLRKLCESNEVELNDLAYACHVNRRSINKYLLGREAPQLESRMAGFFKISETELRTRLGLGRQKTATRRKPRNDRAREPERKKGHPRD